jgi:hypothetical protein
VAVVLVDFWTFTCINWLRTEAYIRAWSRAYRDDGLAVVGVHTPEFSFEHEVNRVRTAVEERDIDYPVAIDARSARASVHAAGSRPASRRPPALTGRIRLLVPFQNCMQWRATS